MLGQQVQHSKAQHGSTCTACAGAAPGHGRASLAHARAPRELALGF